MLYTNSVTCALVLNVASLPTLRAIDHLSRAAGAVSQTLNSEFRAEWYQRCSCTSVNFSVIVFVLFLWQKLLGRNITRQMVGLLFQSQTITRNNGSQYPNLPAPSASVEHQHKKTRAGLWEVLRATKNAVVRWRNGSAAKMTCLRQSQPSSSLMSQAAIDKNNETSIISQHHCVSNLFTLNCGQNNSCTEVNSHNASSALLNSVVEETLLKHIRLLPATTFFQRHSIASCSFGPGLWSGRAPFQSLELHWRFRCSIDDSPSRYEIIF